MGRKQEGVKESERMEDGAEVGGAEDQDELREASVNIRLGVLCSRRPAGSYMNHYWAACCPIDSKPNASKTNVFIHNNTF